jgi:tetratricopeptide (TPR) repeat protein
MFGNLIELLQRAFALVVLALVPFAARLEVTRTQRALAIVGAMFAIIVVGCALALRRRSPRLATLMGVTLVAASTAGFVFRGASGPLARGVWLVSPIVWCAIVAAFAEWKTLKARAKLQHVLAIGFACSALTLLVAWPRISSRSAMWRAIAASNPGDESASTAAAEAMRANGDPRAALAILDACVRANPRACACGDGVAEIALAEDSLGVAMDALERGRSYCADDPRFAGLRAEALVRTNRFAVAAPLADAALSKSPHDPHAIFAKSMVLLANGSFDFALQLAREARDSKELSFEGTLLLDRVWIARGDLLLAEEDLRNLRSTHPNSAAVMYLLGQVEDRSDHYHDAREDYLAALRLDAAYADARYMLALLTARHGAMPEAQYNAEQLARIAPDDPRLPELEKLVQAK